MTPSAEAMIWAASVTGLVFFFALGAIVGSFINVVAYRLPAGLDLVLPPSACPKCETRLTWRENFPIFGWLWLRGRCRFCRSPISPQYPLIELLVALLFAGLFMLWFMRPSLVTAMGLDVRLFQPDWVREGLTRVWPIFLAVLYLVGSLVAITLIDAKTFQIHLPVPWIAAGVGLAAHVGTALYFQITRGGLPQAAPTWAIPAPAGPMLAATFAAVVGLIASNLLLRAGIIPRSYADYEAWEKEHLARTAAAAPASQPERPAPTAGEAAHPGPSLRTALIRTLFFTGPAIALMFLGFTLGMRAEQPLQGMAVGMVVGLVIGFFLRRLVPDEQTHADDPVWIQYPYARREMGKELLFLAPPLLLGVLAFWLASPGGPLADLFAQPPLWLRAGGGSLLGMLIGGGLVWFIRIGGTLLFGKDAMGLGDVHLMAAVGAVLGWITPTLAFFIAPFFGIGWTLATIAFSSILKRRGTALPYGPHLAAATLFVLYARPLVEWFLGVIMGDAVHLP